MSKMVRIILSVLGLFLIAAPALEAASPIAAVDSAQPFLLKGVQVPVNGIGNWPVFSGDRIATRNGHALVSLREGSYVWLDKNTEILLTEKDGRAAIQILKGRASYKLSELGGVALDKVARTARAGTLALANGALIDELGLLAQPGGRSAAPPGTYPIQINWDPTPSGVVTVPGPLPVSAYRGGH